MTAVIRTVTTAAKLRSVLDAERSAGRTVGFVGTAVQHFELGQVALAVLKRNTPDDARLLVGESAAAIDG